jgi:hypothetical protein
VTDSVDSSHRRERNWDAYAAVIASLVGLLALGVSAYTANLERTQLRAQIWPRVEVAYASDRKIVALSVGMGPAQISMVRITLDGKPMKDWDAVLAAGGFDGGKWQSQFSGRVMPPGSQLDLLELPDTEVGRNVLKDLRTKHKIGILACYCSVLDDCWLAGSGHLPGIDVGSKRPIDRCPIDPKQSFTQ